MRGAPGIVLPRLPAPLVLGLACAGVFLAALDQTVVVTALPDVFSDIGLPVTELDRGSWIVTGYLLGYTAAMPLMGRVSDVAGHGRVYLAAMALFVTGSALVAAGESLGWIVGARIVQAAGGGALVPVTIALASELLPGARRGIAIGLVVAVAEAGSVLGPLYGAGMLQALDWRWIFWVNLPAGLPLALAVAAHGNAGRSAGARVDYLGGLLLGASLACLALGLSDDAVLPSGAGWRPGLLAGSVLALLLYWRWQTKTEQPLFPLALFRNVPLASANATNLLAGGALILALVTIPLMTDTVMGQDPVEGGLRLLRLTVMIPIGAAAGGVLAHRFGYGLPTMAGLGLAALGFALLARWPVDVGEPRLTLELMAGGLGFGLIVTPITLAGLHGVRQDQQATAAALVTVMRMVGMIAGLAALSSWGQDRFEALAGGIPLPLRLEGESRAAFDARAAAYEAQVTAATLQFFHEVFWSAMALCLVALAPALALLRRGR